jgi:hypothetical protein
VCKDSLHRHRVCTIRTLNPQKSMLRWRPYFETQNRFEYGTTDWVILGWTRWEESSTILLAMMLEASRILKILFALHVQRES